MDVLIVVTYVHAHIYVGFQEALVRTAVLRSLRSHGSLELQLRRWLRAFGLNIYILSGVGQRIELSGTLRSI